MGMYVQDLFQGFLLKIQKNFNYTNTQMAQIRYVLLSILSDVSKLIIMGIFFAVFGKFPEFVVSAVVLTFIRTNTGGLHFKHYLSCFLFSFAFLLIPIMVIPRLINISRPVMIAMLILCMIICSLVSPIRSAYRPEADSEIIKKNHVDAFKYIFIYTVIAFVLPENPCIVCGFWIINLQTLQLVVANIIKKGVKGHEKFSSKEHV